MNHWYDWVFWIFFGGGIAFTVGVIVWMIVQFIRDRSPRPSPPFMRTSGGMSSSPDTTWGVGGTDSSTGFDSSSSFDSGGSDVSSDSGGGFESG